MHLALSDIASFLSAEFGRLMDAFKTFYGVVGGDDAIQQNIFTDLLLVKVA